MAKFSPMEKVTDGVKVKYSVVSELEGGLLISRSTFPYFMLISFEAGGPLRALVLFLLFPLLWFLELLGYNELSLHLMIFVATLGVKVEDLKAVAKATLPRFYLEDVRESTFRVFSRCMGEKYVVSSIPRIMLESFLREYLDVDHVIATELRMVGNWCLGLVAPTGLVAGCRKLEALRWVTGADKKIDIGLLVDGLEDHSLMLLCKEHRIIPTENNPTPLPRSDYPKPLIFHDGRFVARPTPLDLISTLLWLPLGTILATIRILVGLLLPYKLGLLGSAVTGLRIGARFSEAHGPDKAHHGHGTLFVCSHRTLLDPVVISIALQRRKITAVTYSLSRFSELISPIPTVRLTRDRFKDGAVMRALLDRGDLVVCPEGTTCREPYLLRFSPLFAEIADEIVPVAVKAEGSMFFGTTVRGYKWLDSLFFLMNPSPCYQLEFLGKLSGRVGSSYDVANHVQQSIGFVLGFECTNLTRRDKYRVLAGNDGVDARARK